MSLENQRVRVAIALLATLATLHFLSNRPLIVAILALVWATLYYPCPQVGTDCLSACRPVLPGPELRLLESRPVRVQGQRHSPDALLRAAALGLLLSEPEAVHLGTGTRARRGRQERVAGLAATSLAFSLFAGDPRALFLATAISTAFLLVMFHAERDLQYASGALALGLVVELFGVSTGLWSYSHPGFSRHPLLVRDNVAQRGTAGTTRSCCRRRVAGGAPGSAPVAAGREDPLWIECAFQRFTTSQKTSSRADSCSIDCRPSRYANVAVLPAGSTSSR